LTQIALLDTNIIIAILRRDPKVRQYTDDYMLEYHHYHFSSITHFEVLRGLLLYKTSRQLKIFEQLLSASVVVPLDDLIIERAALIYTELYRRGQLISDADILIGATALVNNWRLITDNERHLRRIPGLIVENWLAT
jgi:tRNA(fMet)-specific endonuclease VapC